jgi:hypothetical protein
MVTSAIERSLISSNVVFPARAGFWRRATALLVDLFLIGVIFLVITILTYDISGGRVQTSGVLSPLSRTDCQSLSTLPAGIEVPTEFGANYAFDCTVRIFGYPVSRVVTVGRQTVHGAVTTNVSVTFMLDKQGKPVHLPSLDLFLLPAVIVWRWWFDRRKGSFGRRMLGVRLLSADETGSQPASAGALAKRYGLFALLFAPAWLVLLYQSFYPGFVFFGAMLPVLLGAAALTGFVILAMIVAIIRGKDTFYDRMAQTRVMQVRPSAAA